MIVSIYEKNRIKRIEDKELVIEEIYYNDNNLKNEKFIKATDGKMNDNIIDKSLGEKRIFKKNDCIKVIKGFNKEIKYTIKSYNNENEVITCSTCGNKGKAKDLIDGCPFCGTNFNIGINNENVTKKQVIAPIFSDNLKKALKVLLVIIIILSIFYGIATKQITQSIMIFILMTGFLICFMPFFLLLFMLLQSIASPENSNYSDSRKEIWKIDKNENIFYSDLYTELMLYFYNDKKNVKEKNLIDFTILEYKNIDFISNEKIKIELILKKIYYINENIQVLDQTQKIIMNYNHKDLVKDKSHQIIKCTSCGADIKITDKECTYCGKINNIKNEWILETIK